MNDKYYEEFSEAFDNYKRYERMYNLLEEAKQEILSLKEELKKAPKLVKVSPTDYMFTYII